jgi:hypothetical protein
MSEEEAEYHLVFKFDTDEPEFARGFEAGKLYATIGDSLFGVSELESAGFVIHHANTELVMRMAEKFNLSFTATEIDDEFVSVALTRKEPSL